MQLRLGTHVRCEGAVVGEVADVVIEPVSRRLTHIVVETSDREAARLVRGALIAEANGEVTLSCTRAEFDRLESIVEFAFVRLDEMPKPTDDADVGVETAISMPSIGSTEFGDFAGEYGSSMGLAYHRIPKGEAEVRRASPVTSSDAHEIGYACGFVFDELRVTHVVLERGHLWGTRDITIPIDGVEKIETDGITLSLTKDEVAGLPAVRLHHLPFS